MCVLSVKSQQLPQSTQHMFSKFMLNPAVAGSDKFLEAAMWYRSQWSGFEGAPTSQALSLQSSFYKKKSGVGGYLFNDKAGPVTNTGMNLSYAYHLPVTRDVNLSMGLGFNLSQYSIDGNKLDLYHPDDPLVDVNSISSTMVPEASTGAYLYHKNFYFGISAMNIIRNKTPVFNDLRTNASMARETHVNIIGAYRHQVEKDVFFSPSFYVNKVTNNPMQAEINLRMEYKYMFQFGISYRMQDALAFLLDVTFLKDFHLSYSYDLQFSELKNYSNGSHEIMLRYQFYYNDLYKKLYRKKQTNFE